jgi:hypothetical protein
MGGTSVAACDLWALSNNPAGTAWLKGAGGGIGFENRYLIQELAYQQLGCVLASIAGSFGLFASRYGNDQYSEVTAGLSYARKFGKYFSAGLKIDYQLIHIADDYGNRNLVTCEIGLIYKADKNLIIGIHFVNPVPVTITAYPPEQLPLLICTGLSYRFSDKFLTSIEAEKDLENPLVLRAGAEYRLAGPACARIGISTNPMSFTFGFGLKFGKLQFDMASGYHQMLGLSPSGSLTYSFK